MSENQIPKATMANFIRRKIPAKKISADFIHLMMNLSEKYLNILTAQSNSVCEKEGKKIISVDHFYQAIQELGMGDIIHRLKQVEESLKKKHQSKQEEKQKVEQNIRKRNQMEEMEQTEKKMFKLENKSELKPRQLEEDADFHEYLEDEQN